MTAFRYDAQVLARFPTTWGGVLVARGLRSGPTPPGLLEAFRAEQAAVLARLGGRPLSEVPSLAAWRRVFRAFGVDPTQTRSAAEALLRRLTKKGDLPSVNLLVDVGNLVSIRYALPAAVLDLRGIAGGITVCLAQGHEPFTELDSDEVKHPEPGEVIFVDDSGVVAARRWCWRQSAQSGAREGTTDVLVTAEAHHEAAEDDVRAALRDLAALLAEHAGGCGTHALLSSERSEFREE
jgi:DNA/RNA-binding domain of Phe-tRNA-synthetase-like protein